MSGEVRLWGGDGHWVESVPSPYGEGYHPYIALPLATHAALVERLRVAEGLLGEARDELPCPGDNRYGETVRDLLDNIETFLGASHVAR